MIAENQYSVHISPTRYGHILDAAREGSEKLRDTLAKAMFWPDRGGNRRYELRNLTSDGLHIAMSGDPDSLARHVLRVFTQSLMDGLHYAMVHGHERTKIHDLNMYVPDAKMPDTPSGASKVQITLEEQKIQEASSLLVKGMRQAQSQTQGMSSKLESSQQMGLSNTRKKTPTPVRKPIPGMNGPAPTR